MLKSEPQSIVVAKDLHKRVVAQSDDLTILSAVSLDIKAGESLAIVGVSGSGKSTLLGLLAGLDEPSSGDVELCGQSLAQTDEDGRARLRGLHVGFVFQSFQLLPNLTAFENVRLPLEIMGTGNADANTRVDELLARVGLTDRKGHYPSQLSGGEQQRVAIARAFVTKPAILFADEPTGNLDSVTGEKIIELLFELNREQHTTLVMVTHDEMLAGRCDRKIRLEAGRIVS